MSELVLLLLAFLDLLLGNTDRVYALRSFLKSMLRFDPTSWQFYCIASLVYLGELELIETTFLCFIDCELFAPFGSTVGA